MASLRYFVTRFSDDEDEFLAYGYIKDNRPVYRVNERELTLINGGKMRFPSCLKFLPYAEVEEMERMTKADFEAKYSVIES